MERVVEYSYKAKEDIDFFKGSGDSKILKRIRQVIESIQQNPFKGIGKPKPLKYNLAGTWSRRINKEHRVIYEVSEDRVFILSLRGHY